MLNQQLRAHCWSLAALSDWTTDEKQELRLTLLSEFAAFRFDLLVA
jgi:hypothetical protein